jgi:hypothetical protein
MVICISYINANTNISILQFYAVIQGIIILLLITFIIPTTTITNNNNNNNNSNNLERIERNMKNDNF